MKLTEIAIVLYATEILFNIHLVTILAIERCAHVDVIHDYISTQFLGL